MSKAFTKDDADDAPLVVPARRPLPPDTTNYVTARGAELLRDELHRLQADQARRVGLTDPESLRATAIASARAVELGERVASAVVVEPAATPDVVRFGVRVTVRAGSGDERAYRIVGVDEADAAHGLVAFVAPLAKALLGRRVGDGATVRTPRGDEELEVVAIES